MDLTIPTSERVFTFKVDADDHVYRKHKCNTDGSIVYYRCIHCSSRAKIQNEVFSVTSSHNHEPDRVDLANKRVREVCLTRYLKEKTALKEIYDEEFAKHNHATISFFTMAQQAKRLTRPTRPSRARVDLNLVTLSQVGLRSSADSIKFRKSRKRPLTNEMDNIVTPLQYLDEFESETEDHDAQLHQHASVGSDCERDESSVLSPLRTSEKEDTTVSSPHLTSTDCEVKKEDAAVYSPHLTSTDCEVKKEDATVSSPHLTSRDCALQEEDATLSPPHHTSTDCELKREEAALSHPHHTSNDCENKQEDAEVSSTYLPLTDCEIKKEDSTPSSHLPSAGCSS